MVLTVLLPVRDDAGSVFYMVRMLLAIIEVPHEILIITDDPDDSSIPTIKKLAHTFSNVRHIENNQRGVLQAVKAGVENSKGKYILIFAADEIGPIVIIDKMLRLMDLGCDFVSGTRYSKGGKRYGGSIIGHVFSWTANKMFSMLSATALTDCTTGIKMFKKEIFNSLNLPRGKNGWSFAFYMAIYVQKMGLSIAEVPFISVDRFFGGDSTFKFWSWMISYCSCFVTGLKLLSPWACPKPKLLFKEYSHSDKNAK